MHNHLVIRRYITCRWRAARPFVLVIKPWSCVQKVSGSKLNFPFLHLWQSGPPAAVLIPH